MMSKGSNSTFRLRKGLWLESFGKINYLTTFTCKKSLCFKVILFLNHYLCFQIQVLQPNRILFSPEYINQILTFYSLPMRYNFIYFEIFQ